MTLIVLSSAIGCSPSALYCIMRFLIHRQIFKETENNNKDQLESTVYAQTPLSRLLMRNGANSMVDLLLLKISPAANGEELWRYTAEYPARSKLIDDAMDAWLG
ncbi:unnamed protein product [Fraxinus pennsylvanica]|uniref:O-methyltransferase dimerisation domain-containing protein n=1 Tax=Fraxinus pennsylvanica TaxID=56036 RepID=A0AAD1ZRQ0_9LAMI|nr:unnamed protein product [Fraxinus pennsylvanica]